MRADSAILLSFTETIVLAFAVFYHATGDRVGLDWQSGFR